MSSRSIGTAVLALGLALGAVTPAVSHARTSRSAATCTSSKLVVWLNPARGGAAAGSRYFQLEFTNLSAGVCTVAGYPGVSAVDLTGRQLGRPASRNPSRVRVVRLAPGETASALFRIAVAQNYPASTCRPVTAAGLRVFPPNQTGEKVVPFPFAACSRSGPTYLSVSAVRKGV